MLQQAPPKLSPRETELMSLLANGNTVAESARQMGVSRRTAVRHLQSARERLGAVTRDEAIALAVAFNLVSIERCRETIDTLPEHNLHHVYP